MGDVYRNANASASSSSSLNSSSHDTEDDHTIAEILTEEEKLSYDNHKLGKRPATYSLAEMQIEGDGNCQFRALADQLFQNPDYHKFVRKQVIKQSSG
ncbi:OVARIAN TUMOR DOMAIN-containing deubiquitinating enzyme 11-like isoform X2 [Salvia splendens]|uniref:OVARIAN TUMOR DOMAIN-containing deubiquitinating enzyme 11-like isoform X2 n=1 Tax=Salvia splendens TaxID=180675 RepID=UPI001C2642C9|nr:OVARIAN TUMOR DOMAIN-containing deubiquitinating enzyme 11-like isoform X2 [Salvia splendens]